MLLKTFFVCHSCGVTTFLLFIKSTDLLISTGSCGACWVKNWGEPAPVSIIKKHARRKWRQFVFIVRYVVRQGKTTFFLILKLELWALNRLSYNFKIVKQVYYSPA